MLGVIGKGHDHATIDESEGYAEHCFLQGIKWHSEKSRRASVEEVGS